MDASKHQTLDRYEPDTALTRLIRIPVRIVVLVLVLPVRMVWDLLAAGWHAFDRTLLRPLGRGLAWLLDTLVLTPLAWLFTNVLTPLALAVTWLATALFIWPWIGLWRYVAVPVAKYGVAVPLVWLYANLLTPLGHGAAWLLGRVGQGVAWLVATLLVAPAAGLWRHVLVPAARYGVIVPLVWLYGAALTPVGHGTAWVFGKVWQGTAWTLGLLWQGTAWVLGGVWKGIAATGRGLGIAVTWLVMTLLVAPASWLCRRVLAPVGREIAAASRSPGGSPGTSPGRWAGASPGWLPAPDRRTGGLGLPHGVHPARPLRPGRALGPGPARRRRGGPRGPRSPRHRPGNRAAGPPRRLARPGRRNGRDTGPGNRWGCLRVLWVVQRLSPARRRRPRPPCWARNSSSRGEPERHPGDHPVFRGRRSTAPAPHRGEEPLGKRQPEGPPPAPAVQRIRLRYTKRGRLRFTSHRDFQRAFERALRRSEVPMAYSAGFTPHPKVSYANAAPTGTGSEAEFLEIALTEARDPDLLRELLDARCRTVSTSPTRWRPAPPASPSG